MHRLAFLLPAALLLVACGGYGGSNSKPSTGGTVVKTIQISEKEFSLTPSTVSLSKTGTYAFLATNNGTVAHAFEIEGNGVTTHTGHISPGSKATLRVTLSKNGTYEMYCPIDGHKAQGMKGTIAVGGMASSGSGTGTSTAQQTTTSAPGY